MSSGFRGEYAGISGGFTHAKSTIRPCRSEADHQPDAQVLRAEIREDMKALADYIAEHDDPAAELREMFDPSDAT